MVISDQRVRRIYEELSERNKLELFVEMFDSEDDKERELSTLVSTMNNSERHSLTKLTYSMLQKRLNFLQSYLHLEILSKNMFIVIEAQRSQIEILQNAMLPDHHLWHKENEKVRKNLQKHFELLKKNMEDDYPSCIISQKEHFKLLFEMREKFEGVILRFKDEKKYYQMMNEKDENKRIEFLPTLKFYKEELENAYSRETQAIEEAKQLLKYQGLWKKEYERQFPLRWIMEAIEEFRERRKKALLEDPVDRVIKN